MGHLARPIPATLMLLCLQAYGMRDSVVVLTCRYICK